MNADRPFATVLIYICLGWLLLEAAAWNRRRAARARIGRDKYAAQLADWDTYVQEALNLADDAADRHIAACDLAMWELEMSDGNGR